MPYSIEHLLENPGNVVVVQRTDAMSTTLDLMIEHEFSQLPVVDKSGLLLGMITYESIMCAFRSSGTKLNKLSVADAMVAAPFHYLGDDLFDLLDELNESDAVVIVESERRVVGIVTTYDTSRFLRNRTEDLMHVEDIEFIIKELIRDIYTGEQKRNGSRKTKSFDELNLGDYINLLVSRNIWRFCAPILRVEKEPLYELLVRIRQTRNDLAHFRSEISSQSREELKDCADWLRSRYQEYEKEQYGGLIDTLLQQQGEITLTRTAQEEPLDYYFPEEGEESPDRRIRRRSRYAILANWLARQKMERVLLTFEQIEEILGSSLPDSAVQLRSWWANDQVRHTHSILWLAVGWKVIYLDLSEGQVIFARIKPDASEAM